MRCTQYVVATDLWTAASTNSSLNSTEVWREDFRYGCCSVTPSKIVAVSGISAHIDRVDDEKSSRELSEVNSVECQSI
jgi:hypothetical protein